MKEKLQERFMNHLNLGLVCRMFLYFDSIGFLDITKFTYKV